jgi:hypothetical protein
MTDVTELITSDHERIRRLLVTLDEAARYAGSNGQACPDWMLAAIWARLATLLILHAAAEQEICFLAIYGGRGNRFRELGNAIAELNDMRDALSEARLFAVGSPAWWHAVNDARRAICDHIVATEAGVLDGFRAHSGPGLRQELGRQWAAFIAARRSDGITEDREFRIARAAQRGETPGSLGPLPDDHGARGTAAQVTGRT